MKQYTFLPLAIVLVGIGVFMTAAVFPAINFAQKQSQPQASPYYQQLLSQAETKGSVRVIVRVKASFQPEGMLLNQAVQAQRAEIYAAQDRILDNMKFFNTSAVTKFKYTPYLAMEVDAAALTRLITHPEVVSIEEDIAVPPLLEDTIPLIGADIVHDSGFTGAGQVVAILDTGVESSHSFLAGKVVSEACYSTTNSSSNDTTVCPNGEDQQIGSGTATPCSFSGCDHGTHVAGIAAGKGDSFSGVAKDAGIIAIQVFHRHDDDSPDDTVCEDIGRSSPCPLAFRSDQIRGLERVFELYSTFDIAAVNMSLGGGEFDNPCDGDPRKKIIDNLLSVGIATVIASGNNGFTNALNRPACISTAISVGSTTKSDTVSGFSNSAFFLDLLAPGSSIKSSVTGNGFGSKNGTSMAAPHVAGAWAVLKQVAPWAEVNEILSILGDNGEPVEDTRDGANNRPKPRIQLNKSFCAPPLSGDWIVTKDCIIASTKTVLANAIIQDGATVFVTSTGFLDLDFSAHHLRVKPGSKLIVKPGGKID